MYTYIPPPPKNTPLPTPGLPLDAHSRVALMAKLGAGAGLQVPMPQPPLPPGPPPPMGGMGALSLGNATIPLPVQGVPGRCLLIKNLFDPFAPDQEVRVGCVPCVAWHAWGQADRTPKQTRPPIYI